MLLSDFAKLQIGASLFMTLLQGLRIGDTAIKAATIASIAAVSTPAIICVSVSIATGVASVAIGILADNKKITKENAFRMTAALSLLTAIAIIVALSVIGAPAALAFPICIVAILSGVSHSAIALLKKPGSCQLDY